ncbi:MAG: hypothetical protein J0H98_02085 [Solirubrobacterales bacterium]|nr:hypothetical protein [Solirubrobacterales bacterium]
MSKEWIRWGKLTWMVAAIGAIACFAASPAGASDKEASRLADAQSQLAAAVAKADASLAEIDGLKARLRTARTKESITQRAVDDSKESLREAASSAQRERDEAAQRIAQARQDSDHEQSSWRTRLALVSGALGLLLILALAFAFWLPLLVSRPVLMLVRTDRTKVAFAIGGSALAGVGIGAVIAGDSGTFGIAGGGALGGLSVGAAIALAVTVWDARRLSTGDGTIAGHRSLGGATLRGASAAAAALAFVLLLGLASVSSEPEPPSVPPDTLALARMGSVDDSPTPRIRVLSRDLNSKQARLDVDADRREGLEEQLAATFRRVYAAKSQIRLAERQTSRWEAALLKPDPAPEPEYVPYEETPAPASSGCDPNYSGCVPPYPPDVDCADVGGSVSVLGDDPHGLDADGDGIGCE